MIAIESENLSIAWAELFLRLMKKGTSELTAVGVTVRQFDENGLPVEKADIRALLDSYLYKLTGRKNRPLTTNDVASTIFPMSMWNRSTKDLGEHLFKRYESVFKRIKARDGRNKRGTYFRRLTSYMPADKTEEPINQLEHIVDTYKGGNHRRSALQASIFDPRLDHNDAPMLGFPCLQQVAFAPTEDGLTVTGFYPVQYIFERAYGNYLGLCWLGLFVAQQLEMPLVEMNCFINVAQLGAQNKSDLREFVEDIEKAIKA